MRSIFALIKSWITKLIARIFKKDDPAVIDEPQTAVPPEVVCYYGCPNSNKAKKLQLNKKIYR